MRAFHLSVYENIISSKRGGNSRKINDGYESNLMGSVEVSDLETWQPKRLVIQYQFHLVGLSEIGLVDPKE